MGTTGNAKCSKEQVESEGGGQRVFAQPLPGGLALCEDSSMVRSPWQSKCLDVGDEEARVQRTWATRASKEALEQSLAGIRSAFSGQVKEAES